MSNAAITYIRVSSQEQKDEGFSLAAQEKLLREYGGKEGFQITKPFTDVETAKQAGRTQFNVMLRYLQEHPEVKHLLVEKVDRLYRNIKDWLTLDEFVQKGVILHFVKEGMVIDRDAHSGQKFMHGIRVLMAKWYVDNLSEETKKGLNEKAAQGIYPALAPLGYRNNTQTKTIEVDLPSAAIVRRLYELYATGQYALRELRKLTVREKLYHPRSQRPMSVSEIESVLKNPFYYGMFYWGKKLYPGIHEPIITKSLFDQVQAVLKRFNKPKFAKHTFTFRGLLTCGHCGCQITAEIQKKRYVYYHCSNSKGKCRQPYLRQEMVDQLFLEQAIKPIALTPKQVEWLREGLRKSFQDQTAYHKARISALQARSEQLQRRLDQIYLDKLDGKVSEEFWEANTGSWRKEQEEIRQTVSQHERANIHFFEDGLKLFELAKDLPAKYVMATPDEKREILVFLASNYTITDVTISPVYGKPFCWFAEYVKTESWGPWADDLRTL